MAVQTAIFEEPTRELPRVEVPRGTRPPWQVLLATMAATIALALIAVAVGLVLTAGDAPRARDAFVTDLVPSAGAPVDPVATGPGA